jgi:hypothetical protein
MDQAKKEWGWNRPAEQYIHQLPSEQSSLESSRSVENNFVF